MRRGAIEAAIEEGSSPEIWELSVKTVVRGEPEEKLDMRDVGDPMPFESERVLSPVVLIGASGIGWEEVVEAGIAGYWFWFGLGEEVENV